MPFQGLIDLLLLLAPIRFSPLKTPYSVNLDSLGLCDSPKMNVVPLGSREVLEGSPIGLFFYHPKVDLRASLNDDRDLGLNRRQGFL